MWVTYCNTCPLPRAMLPDKEVLTHMYISIKTSRWSGMGNVRVSYSRDPQTGLARIVEENNYYPYGLQHSGYNNDVWLNQANTEGQKITFNSRELQNEFDLFVVAMDFRQYDPALGRFTAMDLLAEKYLSFTPYQFGNNNPVYWADPSGLSSVSSEFSHDFMGRERFDRFGMFIIPNERQFRSLTSSTLDDIYPKTSGGTAETLMRQILRMMNELKIDSVTLRQQNNNWFFWLRIESSDNKWTMNGRETILGGVTVGYKKVFVNISDGNLFPDWYNNTAAGGLGLYSSLQSYRALHLSENFIANYGTRTISAVEITTKTRAYYAALARGIGRFSTGLNILTTAYSMNQVYNQFNSGGWNAVDGWDVTDSLVGVGSFLGSGLVAFGSANFWNPVGWTILTGAAIYGGIRLVQELNK